MATRNAHLRPHCVDLTPPVFSSNENRDNSNSDSRSSARTSKERDTRARPAPMPAGAVRRKAEPERGGSPRHIGKLSAAAVVIAGAVVWTTSSSEPFAPVTGAQKLTLKAAVTAPAFFFDDKSDALKRQHAEQVAEVPGQKAGNETQQTLPVALPQPSTDSSAPDQTISVAMLIPPEPPKLPARQHGTSVAPPVPVAPANSANTSTGKTRLLSQDHQLLPSNDDPNGITTPAPSIRHVTVKPGDTLSEILYSNGLKDNNLRRLFTDALVKEHLTDIELGQVIEMTFDEASEFTGLTTRAGSDKRITINRSESGYDVSVIDLPVEITQVVTAGRIEQSLYLAAEQANLKQSTIMELANIFQWELDFARDIRQDDKFSLVYEQRYREGEYIGDGDILAAEFVRGGKAYKAIRFTTDEGESGYYSPDGQSKRRTFMRHPVDVVRITSRFNPNRLHPVLHKIRAHRGVDYGSPHGSPIYATADGRVIYSGAKSAYGNTVILKHGEKFSTLYAHMSKISSKSEVGKRVKQGDVIGYVGKTGRVTGTHLHYEFRVNGTQIDPLKVELPAAAPIDKKYLARLKQRSEEVSLLMTQALDNLDSQVASTSEGLSVIAAPTSSAR